MVRRQARGTARTSPVQATAATRTTAAPTPADAARPCARPPSLQKSTRSSASRRFVYPLVAIHCTVRRHVPVPSLPTPQVDGKGLSRFVAKCSGVETVDLAYIPGIDDAAVAALVASVKKSWAVAVKANRVRRRVVPSSCRCRCCRCERHPLSSMYQGVTTGLKPPLVSIDIRGAKVTDQALRSLAAWPFLQSLKMCGNDDITDDGLSALAVGLGERLQVCVRTHAHRCFARTHTYTRRSLCPLDAA